MSTQETACLSLLRTGAVVDHTGRGLVVDVSLNTACQQCAAGRGCGMGLLARRQQQRITVFPPPTMTVDASAFPVGCQVTIELPKHQINHLTLLIYAMPLCLALMVTGLVSLFGVSEWIAATLFFSALICCVVVLKYLMRGRMERFRPRLVI